MAVLSKINLVNAQRLDTSDLKAMESFVAGDFKALSGFIKGNDGYILKSGEVISASNGMVIVNIKDLSVFLHSNFYINNTDNAQLRADLNSDGDNYIELSLVTRTTTSVSRQFWDPLNTDEFNTQGNTFNALSDMEEYQELELSVNQSGFTPDSIPLAVIKTQNRVMTSIRDSRKLLFESNNLFSVSRITNPQESSDLSKIYESADGFGINSIKGLTSIKDWIDAMSLVVSEIKGCHWFLKGGNESVNNLNLQTLLHELDYTLDSDESTFLTWSKSTNNTPDYKLRTEGLEVLTFRNNRDNTFFQLGGQFIGGRQWGTKVLETQVVYGNVFLRKDFRKVEGCYWNSNEIQGASGDFSDFAVGDFVRKENDNRRWYRIVGYRIGSVWTNPGEGSVIPDTATAIKIDSNASNSIDRDNLIYFRSRYSTDDIILESEEAIERTRGDFATMNLFWLGRRSGNAFLLRGYGTLSIGETTSAGNDANNNQHRPQNLQLSLQSGARFIRNTNSSCNVLSWNGSIHGNGVVFTVSKQFSKNIINNDSDGNYSGANYTFEVSSSNNFLFTYDGDELWANLSESPTVTSHSITSGDLLDTNKYEIRRKNNSPVDRYNKPNIHLVARRQDIGNESFLFFTDGTILSSKGVAVFENTNFKSRVIHEHGRVLNIKRVVSNYQVQLGDEHILVEKPTIEDIIITLPSTTNTECFTGSTFEIKDKAMMCSVTSVIRIRCSNGFETIDEQPEYTIMSEGEGVRVAYTGSGKWVVI